VTALSGGGLMMSIKSALNYYLGKDGCKRMNCAQSILKAFETQFKVGTDVIEQFGLYGRGNAPEGLCGALYAVKYLSENNTDILNFSEFQADFKSRAGAVKCSEIKDAKQFSCLDCIEKCAEFLEQTNQK
jgi:hypothetical protein